MKTGRYFVAGVIGGIIYLVTAIAFYILGMCSAWLLDNYDDEKELKQPYSSRAEYTKRELYKRRRGMNK